MGNMKKKGRSKHMSDIITEKQTYMLHRPADV